MLPYDIMNIGKVPLDDFNQMFNVDDMQMPNNEHVGQYCLWAMNGQSGKPPENMSEAERAMGENWIRRLRSMEKYAQRLVVAGESRDGMAFDGLKRRALALADEVFPREQRGVAFSRVAQVFDQVMQGVGGTTEVGGVRCWCRYPSCAPEKCRLLEDIQKYSSWGAVGQDQYQRCLEEFNRRYPVDVELVEMAIGNGKLYNEVKERAYKLGARRDGEAELTRILAEVQMPGWLEKTVWKSFEAGKTAFRKARDAKRMRRRMRSAQPNEMQPETPKTKVQFAPVEEPTVVLENGGCPNSILNLRPARRWTIVTDETGSEFGNAAFEGGKKSSAGRYAFVLVPDYVDLPALPPKWHAVDKTLDECLAVARRLHESAVGILGMPVANLSRTNRLLWFACIESLLDMVLRLLPIDGDTEIELNVEQRGDNGQDEGSMLAKMLDDAVYQLSLTNPERAGKIKLSGRFVRKCDCPLNGYADLVAYSWGCSRDIQRAFAQFGWRGPCLIAEEPEVATAFRQCLRMVHQTGVLTASDWNVLVTSREAQAVGSLIGALLRAYGEEARQDSAKWRMYLDYVVAHLDSKGIRMSLLAPQISWLKEYEPDGEQLPPRLRLLWLTAQLAASNHRGGTEFGLNEHQQEFTELKRKLKEEDAPLTCCADLHLAVEMTDCFRFEEARALLQPWLDEPIAVPGLRYHGQVLSSLGQHEAFLGNDEVALEYFALSIAEFRRLSERSQDEVDHTLAYAVIAAMDVGSPRLPELMAEYLYGGKYTPELMVDMAHQFAAVGEDEPKSKYAHAILLRYLVTLPADDAVRQAYVAHSAEWKWSEDGHPWELIAFYRAILLGRAHADYTLWLRRGYDLAKTGGPTLQLIACVIGAGLLAGGEMSGVDYNAFVEQVAESLPALGEERLTDLRAQTTVPIPLMDYAKKILPFNFR